MQQQRVVTKDADLLDFLNSSWRLWSRHSSLFEERISQLFKDQHWFSQIVWIFTFAFHFRNDFFVFNVFRQYCYRSQQQTSRSCSFFCDRVFQFLIWFWLRFANERRSSFLWQRKTHVFSCRAKAWSENDRTWFLRSSRFDDVIL